MNDFSRSPRHPLARLRAELGRVGLHGPVRGVRARESSAHSTRPATADGDRRAARPRSRARRRPARRPRRARRGRAERASATPRPRTSSRSAHGSLARVMRAGVRSDHLQTAEAFRRARDGVARAGLGASRPRRAASPRARPPASSGSPPSTSCPRSTGSRDRLASPGARFLDVGAGVGVLSSELCLVYPEV